MKRHKLDACFLKKKSKVSYKIEISGYRDLYADAWSFYYTPGSVAVSGRAPVRKWEATDGIDLAIRGCCGDVAASGHGLPLSMARAVRPIYIAISTECPVTADYIQRPVPLSVLSRIGGGLGFPLYRRAWKDFSGRERGSGHAICVPSKKSRFQVAL